MGERTGEGPPTVLALHGWARTHRDFARVLVPPDAPPVDAIALDLPGFGASPPPPEPWGSPEYARLVAEVLGQMAPRVVVLGHSFGGRVAVELASAHPESVGALVLTGVPLVHGAGRSRPALRFRLGRSLHRIGLLSESRMDRLRDRFGSSDYRNAHGVMRQVLVRVVNERYDDALSSLRCPVDLVWGSEDDVATLALARAAAAHIADVRVFELAGVGHLTPLAAPGALHDALLRRLADRRDERGVGHGE